MFFDIQHVPVGQKFAKTIILTIFLVLAWFSLVMVKILNAMTKMVSYGFKTLRYPGGLAFKDTLVLCIYQNVMVCCFIKSHSCRGLFGALGMEAFGLSFEGHLSYQKVKGLHIYHIKELSSSSAVAVDKMLSSCMGRM